MIATFPVERLADGKLRAQLGHHRVLDLPEADMHALVDKMNRLAEEQGVEGTTEHVTFKLRVI